MEISFCSICNKQFKSGGSYRVHRYRYHRPKPILEQPVEKTQAEESVEQTIEENRTEDDSSGEVTESEEEPSGSGLGWALGIGGAIIAVILFLIFGRKGGDNL